MQGGYDMKPRTLMAGALAAVFAMGGIASAEAQYRGPDRGPGGRPSAGGPRGGYYAPPKGPSPGRAYGRPYSGGRPYYGRPVPSPRYYGYGPGYGRGYYGGSGYYGGPGYYNNGAGVALGILGGALVGGAIASAPSVIPVEDCRIVRRRVWVEGLGYRIREREICD